MKRYLTLVLILICATMAAAEPGLKITSETFNFGFVPGNSKVTHTFWLKSVGTDTLKILKVIPGCSCTQAPLDKPEIAPGDSAALDITFSSGQRIGTTIKHPYLITNAGSGRVQLTFNAEISPAPETLHPMVFKPFKIFVSRAGEIDIDSAAFTIANTSDQDLSLKIISAPQGYFTINVPKTIKIGDTADCAIKVNPEYMAYPFEKSITFEANNPQKTRFTLPVIRRFIGAGKPKE